MKYSISTYYILALFVAFLGSFTLSEYVWPCYLVFFITSFITVIGHKNQFSRTASLFLSLGFFVAYFVRPFILDGNLELYQYISDSEIAFGDMAFALKDVTIGYVAVQLTSFIFSVSIVKNKKTPQHSNENFLVDNFNSILFMIALLVALKFLLVAVLGIGIKGESITSPLAFLARLIAVDLVYGLVVLYFFKYNTQITTYSKLALAGLVVVFSMSILFTGSKSFVMVLVFGSIVYFTYENRLFSLSRTLILGVGLSFLLTFSFVAASTIKISNDTGKSIAFFGNVALELIKKMEPFDILNDVTSRFVGLDGAIMAKKTDTWHSNNIDQLRYIYQPKEVIYRSISGLIPGVRLTTSKSSGVAVGKLIQHLPEDLAYAGALGIIGALQIMYGIHYWKACLVLGFIVGLIFRWINSYESADVKYLLIFFFAYSFFFMVMSGNLDLILAMLLTKIVLLPLYLYLTKLLKSFVNVQLSLR